jgi:hypothetical protein
MGLFNGYNKVLGGETEGNHEKRNPLITTLCPDQIIVYLCLAITFLKQNKS